jgi:inner membrane protein
MDPLSQGVIGATAPMSVARRRNLAAIAAMGFLSGMSADLDVLIQSPSDPLLFLEYHRQFTHSLVFIPFGGLFCALLLYFPLARKRDISYLETWIYCTLGYATHAVLDSCTTYGTQLLWPFSTERFAWNTMSIVDPLFTFPILILVVVGSRMRKPGLARIALLWAVIYPMFGLVQRDRAEDLGMQLAVQRGHKPIHLSAKPSFGNLLIWKIVYETESRYYVDAVRVGFGRQIYPGDSVMKLDLARDFPWLDSDSQQATDIERFRWFSSGYLALDPDRENMVIDIRYSLLPNEIDALWGILLDPKAGSEDHVAFVTRREMTPERTQRYRRMLVGD